MSVKIQDWNKIASQVVLVAQGQTTFAAPPHTFEELVAEAMFVLGVDTDPEPEPQPEPEPEQ